MSRMSLSLHVNVDNYSEVGEIFTHDYTPNIQPEHEMQSAADVVILMAPVAAFERR